MALRSQALPLLLLAPILMGIPGQDERRAPPKPRFCEHGWIEYVPGDSPLILLAPHGGAARPAELRDRREGVLLRDSRTLELARELASAFEQRTGARPHLVLCHLHRSKLDANRAEDDAAQGDPLALAAWRAWNSFVQEARATVKRDHGQGLVIDVHGHSHVEGWIEWGYALSARQLALDDARLELGELGDLRASSSIDALARRHGGARAALLRGPSSLGGLAHAAGYKSVPSPAHPHPDGGHYFDGGYNTRRYGSRIEGETDAIQLEVPRHLRVDRERRRRLASDLAGNLVSFLERWYDYAPTKVGPARKQDGDE